MTKITRDEFLTDLSEVIAGLEHALHKFNMKLTDVKTRRHDLAKKWAAILQSHAEALLPNLNQKTLRGLRKEIPAFVTKEIQRVFKEANELRIPFFTWISGGASAYRVETMRERFDLLQTQLLAFMSSMDRAPGVYEDIDHIEAGLATLDKQMQTLKREEEKTRAELVSLKNIYTTISKKKKKQIPQNVAQPIRESAKKLRARSHPTHTKTKSPIRPEVVAENNYIDYVDDGTDFLILWATGFPTSWRTLALSVLFNANERETFTSEVGGSMVGVTETQHVSATDEMTSGTQENETPILAEAESFTSTADERGFS